MQIEKNSLAVANKNKYTKSGKVSRMPRVVMCTENENKPKEVER